METLAENNILKTIQDIFNYYLPKGKETLNKTVVLRIFFDYDIMDNCGYDIFQISNFLNQLNPTNDEIDIKKFLLLLFYIYRMQINKEFEDSDVTEISVDNVNELSDNRKQIVSSNNIIRIMINQKEKLETFFYFEVPDFTNETVNKIVQHDELMYLEGYHNAIKEKIFNKYSQVDTEKGVRYINVVSLNNMFFELPIFVNFTKDQLANFCKNFIKIHIQNDQDEEIYKQLFDKKLNVKEVNEIFNNFLITTSDVNFSYSAIVIFISFLAMNLESTNDMTFEQRIKFYFEEQLKLLRDDAEDETQEKINEETKEDQEEDYLPESETLNKAKLRQINEKEDVAFLDEFLSLIDKNLPEEDEYILAFQNDLPTYGNTIHTNAFKVKPAKFPVETLDVEIQEARQKQLEEKENIQIAKAAKPKKEKEKNPNPLEFSMAPLHNEEETNNLYFGQPRTDTLTHRLLKHTYKEILPNSNVYPSLIKEVLMIPSTLQSKSMELIVESFKDQVSGHLETAIRRLEKAKESLSKTDLGDNQVNIFFNLSFGSLYESMDYDIVAMKYYYEAKSFSDKLPPVDPDGALVYCFLGELFVKLKEFSWAMRAFLKAKKIREDTIGGDTPDTAAVYNNLGVVAYHLQSYLPANGYFKLAYEIYKSLLGLTHPRTLMIKSNLTKMKNLSFSKAVEFKQLSMYPTPAQIMQGGRKKK